MQEFELNLIDNSVSLRNRDGFLRSLLNAIVFTGTLLFLATHMSYPIVICMSFVSWFFASKLTRRLQKDWLQKSNSKGTVFFTSKTIKLEPLNRVVNINEINKLNIIGDYYQGYSMGPRDVVHNGLYSFMMEFKNGNNLEFRTVVFSKKEFELLTEFVKNVYTSFDVEISEKAYNGHVGFMLRHDRKFTEIQKLKKELDLID